MSMLDFRGSQMVLAFDGAVDRDLVKRVEAVFGCSEPGGELGYGGTREDLGWRIHAMECRDYKTREVDVLTVSRHTVLAYISASPAASPLALPASLLPLVTGLPATNAASVLVRSEGLPPEPTSVAGQITKVSRDILEGAGAWEPAVRRDFIALWLMAQAVRLMMNDLPESRQRLRFFISHAKLDGVPLARAILGQIEMLGAMRDFYDVRDLDQKGDIDKQLRLAVEESVLIILRSDFYDERPWCRWEMERAEEFGCPTLVVDARTRLTHAPSSLTYAAAPSVRIPDGNTLRILSEALRLSLRTAMARRKIADAGDPNVVFIPRTPSVLSLVMACRKHVGSSPLMIVHPEPALERGAWEAAREVVETRSPGGRVSTVSEYLAQAGLREKGSRPLAGLVVGLSISEPEDLQSTTGFTKADVSRFVVRFSETLLGLGARLVFGHDWRPGGVMEVVSEAAIRYRQLTGGDTAQRDTWSILNLVPWPDVPAVEAWRRERFQEVIRIEEAGLPISLEEWRRFAEVVGDRCPAAPERNTPMDPLQTRWWRAVALSHLRCRLTQQCDVRVCLGGKVKPWSQENRGGHQGWFAGVIEEAFSSQSAGKPVLLGGLFGGASRLLISTESDRGSEVFPMDRALLQANPNVRILTPGLSMRRSIPPSVDPALVDRMYHTREMEEFLLLTVKALVMMRQ